VNVITYDTMRVLREFLVVGEPLCGATIARSLKIGTGTLYPMLHRMKAAGWIEHHASLTPPNEPTSHYYVLTKNGRLHFLEKLCRLTIPDYLWKVDP
jgi:DNA-binding PadR family transcriptional regulator